MRGRSVPSKLRMRGVGDIRAQSAGVFPLLGMIGEHMAIQVGDVPKCDLAVRAVQRGHHGVHEALVEMQHPLCVEQVAAMRAGQTPPIRCRTAGGERSRFSAATEHE
jgi:hypothetical protein